MISCVWAVSSAASESSWAWAAGDSPIESASSAEPAAKCALRKRPLVPSILPSPQILIAQKQPFVFYFLPSVMASVNQSI
jgi:hypothetical protein